MVSTRRRVEAEAAVAQPMATTPASSRKGTPARSTPYKTPMAVEPEPEDTTNWADIYREKMRLEREADNRTFVSRLAKRARLLWFQFRISMGPFMLDPWEQALCFVGIAVLMYALVHALTRIPSVSWAIQVVAARADKLARPPVTAVLSRLKK